MRLIQPTNTNSDMEMAATIATRNMKPTTPTKTMCMGDQMCVFDLKSVAQLQDMRFKHAFACIARDARVAKAKRVRN